MSDARPKQPEDSLPDKETTTELVLASGGRWLERNRVVSQEALNALLLSSYARAERLEGHQSPYELSQPARVTLDRLRGLAQQEQELPTPEELGPRFPLLIKHRCASGTVFEAAKQLTVLDLAFRRAEALSRQFAKQPRESSWPRPTRPERCGLLVVDASAGSLDTVLAVYGSLVAVAQTGPVSLIAMASLIWDATKTAQRIGRGWVARIHGDGMQTDELDWRERTMKAAMPLMTEAVASGRGVSLTMSNRYGDKVELIVTDRHGQSPHPSGSADPLAIDRSATDQNRAANSSGMTAHVQR